MLYSNIITMQAQLVLYESSITAAAAEYVSVLKVDPATTFKSNRLERVGKLDPPIQFCDSFITNDIIFLLVP